MYKNNVKIVTVLEMTVLKKKLRKVFSKQIINDI